MNLTTNNINFNGKQEIFYGLKMAAQEAKNINVAMSYSAGPRGVNRSNDMAHANGAMKAYIDMVMNDKYINQGIRYASEDKDLVKFLKDTLSTQQANNITINPLETFAHNLTKASQNQTDYFKKMLAKLIDTIKM